MKSERILVVDDDEKICQILGIYLRSKGYEVTACKNGANAIQAFADNQSELIILDVNLPGMDGFSILGQLRKNSSVPVIMLTARSGVDDRVRALDLGADDYVVKPFDCRELLARIRAVFRRSNAEQRYSKQSMLHMENLLVDRTERYAEIDGRPVKLTPKEFGLLELLLLNRDTVVARGRISETVWGEGVCGRTLDVHVKRLRRKLEGSSAVIETVHGVGYKLCRRKTEL